MNNSENWNGIPDDADKDGAHQITLHRENPYHMGPWIVLWCSVERTWADKWGNICKPDEMKNFRYMGKLMTVEENTESLAKERERCAFIAENMCNNNVYNPPRNPMTFSYKDACLDITNAIRNMRVK
jgi:hypothetical protein